MRLRNIILAEKENLTLGPWSQGKMPRTAFPLSKSGGKAYRLGNRRWRVVTFEVRGTGFRLLVNYSAELGQFQAMLGMLVGPDTKVIAQYEKHPTHKGWHTHAACGDLSEVPPGIKRGPWLRDLEKPQREGDPDPSTFTDEAAFRLARKLFRLDNVPPLGLLP